MAQDAAGSTTPAPEERKMTITGTRLTAVEAEGALSVSPYALDKPIYTGYSSTAEMLRQKLPQFGGGTGTANDAFANGGDGSASVSLRGRIDHIKGQLEVFADHRASAQDEDIVDDLLDGS